MAIEWKAAASLTHSDKLNFLIRSASKIDFLAEIYDKEKRRIPGLIRIPERFKYWVGVSGGPNMEFKLIKCGFCATQDEAKEICEKVYELFLELTGGEDGRE